MFKHLVNLWILIDYGKLIFTRKPISPDLDDQCLGGFISAIYTLGKELRQKLFRFSTDKYEYYLIGKHEALFVGIYKRKKSLHEDIILKELRSIRKLFFKRYPQKELENWDNNVDKFIGFKDDLKKEELLGVYIDALWNHSLVKSVVKCEINQAN